MTTSNSIKFNQLSKSFSRRAILDNISISLDRGTACILSGENGTGKTTLLRILAGLERPQNCLVDWGNRTDNWNRSRKKLLQQIMYLHQRPYMFEGSVAHNLELAIPRTLSGKQRTDQVREAIEWGILDRHALEPAKTLSGGQQQRLALARAWLRKSHFLLLDEPVSNLDVQSCSRTVKLLQRLKSSGTALVICTHNSQVFEGISDRHLLLENGKIRELEGPQYGKNVTFLENNRIGQNTANAVD